MTSGPEHYRAAERLMETAANPQRILMGVDPDTPPDEIRRMAAAIDANVVLPEGPTIVDGTIAAAQVHATLALAAATAAGSAMSEPNRVAWREVLG